MECKELEYHLDMLGVVPLVKENTTAQKTTYKKVEWDEKGEPPW